VAIKFARMIGAALVWTGDRLLRYCEAGVLTHDREDFPTVVRQGEALWCSFCFFVFFFCIIQAKETGIMKRGSRSHNQIDWSARCDCTTPVAGQGDTRCASIVMERMQLRRERRARGEGQRNKKMTHDGLRIPFYQQKFFSSRH